VTSLPPRGRAGRRPGPTVGGSSLPSPGGTAAEEGRRDHRLYWLSGLAFAGVVFAHRLAYIVAFPDPHHRSTVLESTGHHYLPLLGVLSIAALAAGIIGLVAQRLLHAGARRPGLDLNFRSVAAHLAVLQCAGFLGLELTERLLSGAELELLLAEPATVVGLLVQLVVAIAGAILVTVLRSAVDRFTDRRYRDEFLPTTSPARPRWRALPLRFRVAAGGATVRAPPSSPPA
jgi:hypothetical protein